MLSNDLEVLYQETKLNMELASKESRTRDQAKKFAEFACLCVRETTVAFEKKLLDLALEPKAREAFELAERWLHGDATLVQVEDAEATANQIALNKAGTALTSVAEEGAALWAIDYALKAVERTARLNSGSQGFIPVAGQEEDDSQEVATEAIMAASMARKSVKPPRTLEAIKLQRSLVARVWGAED